MNHLAISVTDFGDSAVTLPLAAVAILMLLALRRTRMALLWGGAIATCAAAIGVLKWLELDVLYSPSGHAAVSAVVYGGFALAVGPSLPPILRWLSRAGALVLIAAIAATRIILHEHTAAETVIGVGVGMATLLGLRLAMPQDQVPAWWLCLAAALVVVVMHGTRWHAEAFIHGLG